MKPERLGNKENLVNILDIEELSLQIYGKFLDQIYNMFVRLSLNAKPLLKKQIDFLLPTEDGKKSPAFLEKAGLTIEDLKNSAIDLKERVVRFRQIIETKTEPSESYAFDHYGEVGIQYNKFVSNFLDLFSHLMILNFGRKEFSEKIDVLLSDVDRLREQIFDYYDKLNSRKEIYSKNTELNNAISKTEFLSLKSLSDLQNSIEQMCMIELNKNLDEKSLVELGKKINSTKQSFSLLKAKMRSLIKQLQRTASKSHLEVVQRKMNQWNPKELVTVKEFKEMTR